MPIWIGSRCYDKYSTAKAMQASFVPAAQPARVRVSSSYQRQRIARLYSPGSSGRTAALQLRATADVHADPQPAPSTSGVADTPTSNTSQTSNGSVQPVTGVSSEAAESGQARSASPSWEGTTTGEETDWVGEKPFTWKDIDWGLASLVGGILLLSLGAYRVLNYFSVYQHSRHPRAAQITTVVQRPSASSSAPPAPTTPSSPPAAAAATPPPATSSKSKPSRSRKNKHSKQQAETAASEAGTAAPEAAATAGAATAAAAGAAAGFELPTAGVPGAPQPSPLDAGFTSMPGPWAGGELGQLDLTPLAPLPEPSAPLQPPELPTIQVELPAKAVTQAELAALPTDPSLPSLRERAHIAMRASGAAMEASQRAAAYSAAASSAASRAAEAAEQAAAAAAAVQAALERTAEQAMVEAVKRMNRAVEMVADAESRAAAAAAMATAYQDISDSQAAAAAAAADLPVLPSRAGPAGHMANLQQVLHEQLFSVRTVLGDWVAGIWAAIVVAVAAVQALLAAVWAKLLGVFSFGAAGSQPPTGATGAAASS